MKGRRVCWPERGKVVLEAFEVGPPGPGQVLLRTEWTLISSGTEGASLMALPNTPGRYPARPGYNNVGRVAEVGPEVEGLAIGDRVAVQTGHASVAVVPAERVVKVPEGLAMEEAVFFCMGAICLQGVRKARVELGESVLVVGQGIIGNLALQLARLDGGMPVIGADVDEGRLALSKRCGADHVIDVTQGNLEEQVKALTDGKGADVVIEATGSPEALVPAFQAAGWCARVALLASTRGETPSVNFYRDVHKKGLVVIGAHNSVRPERESTAGFWTLREDTETVLRLLAAGRLNVRDLTSVRLKAEEAPKGYQMVMERRRDVQGILLDWRDEK
ncbi:MAG: zinc-binding alcohol dehydrogenase [Candidatus Latescibacteria bacterium]|nr:zinc-binding alcohol dehydrogenase [Candidatus Latescibacterota bacterium]